MRIMRRAQRRNLVQTPMGRAIYDNSRGRVKALLEVVDSLTF
jgi:hypothetical protein